MSISLPSKLLVAAASLLLASQAFSYQTLSNKTIERLYTYDNGVLIQFSPLTATSEGCTHGSANQFAFLDTTVAGGKTLLASVLSAHISNKAISIGVHNCLTWGPGTLPKAYRVDF